MSKYIRKVIVGSKLHRLDTPKSDTDIRGIHISEIKDVINPFDKLKNTHWIESEDEDSTSYELNYLAKLLTTGNPTALEILFSDKVIMSTEVGDEISENWLKFMNTKSFIDSSLGYSHNQYNKFYNFEGPGVNGQERTAKFAVAFLRVMWQCEQFLLTGEFKCDLRECDMYELMKKIKPLSKEEIQPFIPEVFGNMSEMNNRVSYASSVASEDILNLIPDYEWIKSFLNRAYINNKEN